MSKDFVDPLAVQKQVANTNFAVQKEIKLLDQEEQSKLWGLYNSDEVIQQIISYIKGIVFTFDFNIILPNETPFYEVKKNSLNEWKKFILEAIDWYYMYGMIPYRIAVDNKNRRIFPVIADMSTGQFGYQKTRLGTTKAVYVTSEDKKKKTGIKTSQRSYKVHVFKGRLISYDYGRFPSPFLNLLPMFYRKNNYQTWQDIDNHRGGHRTIFITRERIPVKWQDMTDNQGFNPEDRNSLERHSQWLDDQNYKELVDTSTEFNMSKDDEDIIRNVVNGSTHIVSSSGRSERFIPLPGGNSVSGHSFSQWNFNLEYYQTHYEEYASNLAGVKREMVFDIQRSYVGNVETMHRQIKKTLVDKFRELLTTLFDEVWEFAFNYKNDLKIFKNSLVSSLKKKADEKKNSRKSR